jgi:hypothetical protein
VRESLHGTAGAFAEGADLDSSGIPFVDFAPKDGRTELLPGALPLLLLLLNGCLARLQIRYGTSRAFVRVAERGRVDRDGALQV